MKLIGYLSNGYPSLDQSVETAKVYADSGCDIIEVDLPARDPYLEGPLISDRMRAALEQCDDYDEYMANIAQIAEAVEGTSDVLLLAYVSTLKEVGVEHFIEFCKENGFSDLILVGLEDDSVKQRLIDVGIQVSCYVQRALDPAEVAAAKDSNGFVYLQFASTEVSPDHPELADCIDYLREVGIDRPIYCGVGIYTPDDFLAVEQAGADGAFVGSTILKVSDNPEQLATTIRSFAEVRS